MVSAKKPYFNAAGLLRHTGSSDGHQSLKD